MAKTYNKLHLKIVPVSDSYLSFAERELPEGGSQTFAAGAPLYNSSGNLIVWDSSTSNKVIAFALDAGQNVSAGTKKAKVVLALPEIFFEANFMGSAGADNTLAAADLFLTRDLKTTANFPSTSANGWYIEDASADVACRIVSFQTSYVFPTTNESGAVADDVNARVLAHLNPGVSAHY